MSALENNFFKHKALVIGDIMLDRYLWGEVKRISAEAPIPIFRLTHNTETAGGAGNVALNLSGLGLKTSLIGLIGEDLLAEKLKNILKQHKINIQNIITSPTRPTITKTRIISGHQQLIRIDEESLSSLIKEEIKSIQSSIQHELDQNPSVIILSDYLKGVLSTEICEYVILEARKKNIPILIDPKGNDFSKYKNATSITPNRHELATICKTNENDFNALIEEGKKLISTLKLSFLVLTRGEEGITLIEPNKVSHMPAVTQDVFDVSGAGDTVISTLAACLASNIEISDSIHLANLAAGIVVSKVGTVPIQQRELVKAISIEESIEQSAKICEFRELMDKITYWRSKNETIVFTNGCFDILHAGHITYLEKAKKQGNHLIIGLNSDNSVKKLKGETRPIVHQEDRAKILAALSCVDAVTIFDQETPLHLIQDIKPDILVKGNDYTEEQVVGSKDVKSWGGQVSLIPLLEGRSTTRIINQLK